ncbi:MAG: B12-binding domain-containing radical SAM protein [Acidobacteria bacterium]|nr:B12-binding domain-containing radical SAM protein [Acidobacteriota bacterium]
MRWPPVLVEPVFRPPSEASSLILQLTVGCSWNRCTYCAMYRGKELRVRPVEEVLEEVRGAAAAVPRVRRVFLADGDALAAPGVLEAVLGAIREELPDVQRVGIYGDSRSILRHGAEGLARLRKLGLGIVYFGPETGDEATLRAVRKGATVQRQLEASRTVLDAGIKLSVMVLLGLAGVEGSERHARATGRFLVDAAPTYAAALTVTPVPGTELFDAVENGAFQLPDRWGMLRELGWMLEEMEGYRGPFHANHASNYLPLKLRLPRDREPAMDLIRRVLETRDETALRPGRGGCDRPPGPGMCTMARSWRRDG